MKFGMWQHDMLKYHMPKLWQCAVNDCPDICFTEDFCVSKQPDLIDR